MFSRLIESDLKFTSVEIFHILGIVTYFSGRGCPSRCWLPLRQPCSVNFLLEARLEQLMNMWLTTLSLFLSLSVPWHRVNVGCGPAEERVLLTGLHAVADIYCENCKTTLGWKYVSTEEFGWWREGHEGDSWEPHSRRKLSVAWGDCLRPGRETELKRHFLALCLPHSFFPCHR